MNVKYLIQKSKGNAKLHAGFIFGKADSYITVDKAAVLCMENKK